MAELKNQSINMNDATLIAGRCRLYGIQVSAASKTLDLPTDPTDSTITLTNGSSGGDILFKFSIQSGNASGGYGFVMPIPFMFGNNWILFDSGIYVNQMTSATAGAGSLDRDLVQLSVFYEGA